MKLLPLLFCTWVLILQAPDFEYEETPVDTEPTRTMTETRKQPLPRYTVDTGESETALKTQNIQSIKDLIDNKGMKPSSLLAEAEHLNVTNPEIMSILLEAGLKEGMDPNDLLSAAVRLKINKPALFTQFLKAGAKPTEAQIDEMGNINYKISQFMSDYNLARPYLKNGLDSLNSLSGTPPETALMKAINHLVATREFDFKTKKFKPLNLSVLDAIINLGGKTDIPNSGGKTILNYLAEEYSIPLSEPVIDDNPNNIQRIFDYFGKQEFESTIEKAYVYALEHRTTDPASNTLLNIFLDLKIHVNVPKETAAKFKTTINNRLATLISLRYVKDVSRFKTVIDDVESYLKTNPDIASLEFQTLLQNARLLAREEENATGVRKVSAENLLDLLETYNTKNLAKKKVSFLTRLRNFFKELFGKPFKTFDFIAKEYGFEKPIMRNLMNIDGFSGDYLADSETQHLMSNFYKEVNTSLKLIQKKALETSDNKTISLYLKPLDASAQQLADLGITIRYTKPDGSIGNLSFIDYANEVKKALSTYAENRDVTVNEIVPKKLSYTPKK